MNIGILKLILFIPESNSLKDRRMVLHSLKMRLRNNFNISIAQLDDGDKWQKAILVAVAVEKEKANLNSILSKVVNFIDDFRRVDIIDYEMEMI